MLYSLLQGVRATRHLSGVERGLIWSMIHSVEMARAVVDSLLDAGKPSTTAR